jgi:hypothetical protein
VEEVTRGVVPYRGNDFNPSRSATECQDYGAALNYRSEHRNGHLATSETPLRGTPLLMTALSISKGTVYSNVSLRAVGWMVLLPVLEVVLL